MGLCLERSAELVVGLLGVLKAGGAWVPLDPAYPADRLAFVMGDAQVPVLLTQERLLSKVASTGSAPVVSVPGRPPLSTPRAPRIPRFPAASDELAYVIYTSGSTAVRRGAMNSHRGIRNRCSGCSRWTA